ncbi:hypothetical protein C5167_008140 [Papaver somniferum]|uniref:Uncharacterized protein n=1 Tax=Papaver somniferum TaxID=3469 RepID=A0A4Y7JUR4_PAPSO|nr:hypothetical protein C5167_008140 [Papaver somniferum]
MYAEIKKDLLLFLLEVGNDLKSMCRPKGPGGVWCDVDVIDLSYFGAAAPPKNNFLTHFGGLINLLITTSEGLQEVVQELINTLAAVADSMDGESDLAERNIT